MKKIIITIIILLSIPITILAQNKGYKKSITLKESAGLFRNPSFIELTVEDENLKKDDNVILIETKTNKEVPIYILEKLDKKIKFRFETILDKNEEKQFEFRFGTNEKSTEVNMVDYSFPNFVGTEFYGISFEKIYIIGLKENDVIVTNKDGKTLFNGKIKYGQYKRIDLSSPQIFNVKSTGPIIVTVSSIGLQNDNSPQDSSDDDLTYLIGSEGFFFSPKNIFVVSFTDSNSTLIEDAGGELLFKGNLNKGELLNKKLKSPSLIYYKSNNPLLIIYGVYDDSTFLPIIPYKSNFYGITFGDLKVFSLDDDLSSKINLLSTKKTFESLLKKYEYKTIESGLESFNISFNKNLYLYLLGNSSNFGGEQILNNLGSPNDKDFTFLTGKISTKYSTGHKRVVYILSLYDNNEVTIKDLTSNKTNKVTLQKMGIYQYETENTLSKINIVSNNDVLVFETSNHINREIYYNLAPIKDDSILISLGKTEIISGVIKPPTNETKPPINQKPTFEAPKGIINTILWEISLIKDRFVGFVNNFIIILPFIKNISFSKIKFPNFLEKLNSYLPPFLQGINFLLIIAVIILLIILLFLMLRKKKASKSIIEEIEEIEVSKEGLEPVVERKQEFGFEKPYIREEEKPMLEEKEIEEIDLKKEKEETKETEYYEEQKKEKKLQLEELMPKQSIVSESKMDVVIPKISKTEKVVDTSIFKGKVVLDRKAILKLLEMDYFPFLEEAYITSKVASELPLKYRTSQKIKPVELTRFEESMAEDLGKRVGGSKDTGEAIALALKLKIDKCIVGEKFNKIFQNINIYSYENFE